METTDDREIAKLLLTTFIKLNNWLRHQFHSQMPDLGKNLTPAQFKTLFMIRRMQPCKMRDLSDHSFVSTSSLTIMLDKLVEAGLVERSTVPEDRRVVQVQLTPPGKALLSKVEQENISFLESKITGLPEADKANLAKLLQEMGSLLDYSG